VFPNSITIRPAVETDLQAAFILMNALGYTDLSLPRFVDTFHKVMSDPSTVVLLAEADGAVVGLATVSKRPQLRLTANLVTIDELAVAPEWRGQNIGHALLEKAKEIAGNPGCRRLELLTSRSRESYTRGFYVKNGFTEVDSAVMRIEYELEDE
jgi:N-acetylglutamate synthase-like GNAT family acetyltransferase